MKFSIEIYFQIQNFISKYENQLCSYDRPSDHIIRTNVHIAICFKLLQTDQSTQIISVYK